MIGLFTALKPEFLSDTNDILQIYVELYGAYMYKISSVSDNNWQSQPYFNTL